MDYSSIIKIDREIEIMEIKELKKIYRKLNKIYEKLDKNKKIVYNSCSDYLLIEKIKETINKIEKLI